MIFISPETRFFALQQDMVRLESGPFPLLKSSCDGIGQNFRHILHSLNLLSDQAASLGQLLPVLSWSSQSPRPNFSDLDRLWVQIMRSKSLILSESFEDVQLNDCERHCVRCSWKFRDFFVLIPSWVIKWWLASDSPWNSEDFDTHIAYMGTLKVSGKNPEFPESFGSVIPVVKNFLSTMVLLTRVIWLLFRV